MEKHAQLCMNCFSEKSAEICPICGWKHNKPQVENGLPHGALLASKYIVGRAKAMNGEGISYAAFDRTTKKVVTLREFYPISLSKRSEDNSIFPISGSESAFEDILDRFINLSKNISRLKEVTVINTIIEIFEENYTAYSVYEYVPSISLQRYIEKSGVLDWNSAYNLFLPLLSALSILNSLGVSHLGISPNTVRVTTEGNLLLTGFSVQAARKVGTELVEELFSGCSALEQYKEDAFCGEITDVYAFAATLLFALTGQLPNDAPKRLKDPRLLIPKEFLREIPPHAVSALANALQLKQEDRTASFERLKAELAAQQVVLAEVNQNAAIKRLPSMENGKARRGLPPVVWLISACVVTLIVSLIIINAKLAEKGMSFVDIKDIFKSRDEVSRINEIPNMLGGSLEEWEERIAFGGYEFTLRVKERLFSDTVPEGCIISQDPGQGEALSSDKVVEVTVSRGSEQRVLPEIKGLSYEDAQKLLEKSSFTVSREDQANSGVAAGFVVGYKDHQDGQTLVYGSTVTVIVSAGDNALSTQSASSAASAVE